MRFVAKASPDQPAPTSDACVAMPSLYMPYQYSSVATPSGLFMAHLLLSMTFAPLANAKAHHRSGSGSAENPNTRFAPLPESFSLTNSRKSSCVQFSLG